MKVLIAVTHLLGAGHLSRALTLGRAFVAQGHDVTILSGGQPAPHMDYTGINLVQMPAIASDGTNFTRLLNAAGRDVDAPYMQSRIDVALTTLHQMHADVVITELFPFGRRSLGDEFLALLKAAHAMTPRPRVLCSIRDILAPPSKPSKAVRAQAVLHEFFDAVLVHSDPNITTLGDSWPVTPALDAMLRYTGYVAPPAATVHPLGIGQGEVLVSAGGGSVGQALFECAVKAARQSDRHWRLLIGGKDRIDRINALQARAGDLNITIEAVRPDFRQMLQGAACSVSMCGYNTALDLLQTGVPSVLVPFDDGGEVEQTLRARSLAQQRAVRVLMAADMTPDQMAALTAQVMADGARHDEGLQMNGAEMSVALVTDIVAGAGKGRRHEH